MPQLDIASLSLTPTPSLADLPEELLLTILSHLRTATPPHQYLTALLTNQTIHRIGLPFLHTSILHTGTIPANLAANLIIPGRSSTPSPCPYPPLNAKTLVHGAQTRHLSLRLQEADVLLEDPPLPFPTLFTPLSNLVTFSLVSRPQHGRAALAYQSVAALLELLPRTTLRDLEVDVESDVHGAGKRHEHELCD
ncbi:hypothetical protein LTS18_006110, partial [Coniosporium uncinatum]